MKGYRTFSPVPRGWQVHQKIPVRLPALKKTRMMPVPGYRRPYSVVFVSDNRSYSCGYDVLRTSVCQKGRLTGIPGSGSAILHLFVLDFFFSYVYSTPVFLLGVDLAQPPEEVK